MQILSTSISTIKGYNYPILRLVPDDRKVVTESQTKSDKTYTKIISHISLQVIPNTFVHYQLVTSIVSKEVVSQPDSHFKLQPASLDCHKYADHQLQQDHDH